MVWRLSVIVDGIVEPDGCERNDTALHDINGSLQQHVSTGQRKRGEHTNRASELEPKGVLVQRLSECIAAAQEDSRDKSGNKCNHKLGMATLNKG